VKRQLFILLVVLPVLLLAGSAAAQGDSPPAANSYVGTLTVIVGDPMPVAGEPMTPVPPIFTLNLADGRELRLLPGAADENALLRLAGQRVSVTLPAAEVESALAADDPAAPGVPVASAALAPGAAMVSPEVSGNTKWLSIACKFADVADEPKPLSYFQNMYANTYPGLDHYWREASYGNINLLGSTAVGWYTLPQPLSYYRISHTQFKLTELFNDCVALANPSVNFGSYVGINLMFNADTGCCAWGGYRDATLDGVTKRWNVTWLPPWAFENLAILHHEMTHAYGILWHSMVYDFPYSDPWDVVSDADYGCLIGPPNDPVYGCLGQHTSAYHRYYLGWITPQQVVVAGTGTIHVTLERATMPVTGSPRLVLVPINSSMTHFYAVEARQMAGYDLELPGPSVVIHEIGGAYPSSLAGPMAGYGLYAFPWQPGDVWTAPQGGIAVTIDEATATGFRVTIYNGLPSQTVTLTPRADTYIDQDQPNTNFGGSTTLLASEDVQNTSFHAKAALIGFDESQLPRLVSGAHLRLTAVGGLPATLPRVLVWSTQQLIWCEEPPVPLDEYRPTWANQRTQGCILMPLVETPAAQGSNWLEYEVYHLLNHNGPKAANTLAIDYFTGHSNPNLTYDTFVFSSREGANPPQLIVEYLVPPDEPTTHTFAPTNDATATQAKPNLASGSKPTLQVRDAAKDLNAYVKFNVTGLDGAVQSATLRLWVTNGGPDGGRVYATSPFYRGTTTQWLETGLKWNNAPAISGAPLDDAGAVAAGQWIELDVTGAVTGNGRASFALTNDKTDLVVYSSKEGAHPPQLVVVTD
jgi:M6 family metalloprotease-like protein